MGGSTGTTKTSGLACQHRRGARQCVALREVSESPADARVAESRAHAGTAIALGTDAPETGLLLAVEAYQLVHNGSAGESYEARNALVLNLERFAAVRAFLRGHWGAVWAVSFSPDGKRSLREARTARCGCGTRADTSHRSVVRSPGTRRSTCLEPRRCDARVGRAWALIRLLGCEEAGADWTLHQ